MTRLRAALLVFALFIVAGCAAPAVDGSDLPDLPSITPSGLQTRLAAAGKPAVVNVWASWCGPCRSEAPLLDEAHSRYRESIEFIGIDVQDTQTGAKRFLAEFGLDFSQFFDKDRAIPNAYGGFGTPLTMFFGPDGQLIRLHNGVIDERTLALNIDELTRLTD